MPTDDAPPVSVSPLDPPTPALDKALATAMASISNAAKSRANEHFKSRYATLGDVYDACRAALGEAGIAYPQQVRTMIGDDNRVYAVVVRTTLRHAGEVLASELEMPVLQSTAQGVGSAITYARRYALSAMVGVAPDEDDDGVASTGDRQPAQRPEEPATKRPVAAKPKAAANGGKPKGDMPEDPLRDIVKQRYTELGAKSWRPWSEVLQASEVLAQAGGLQLLFNGALTQKHLQVIDQWLHGEQLAAAKTKAGEATKAGRPGREPALDREAYDQREPGEDRDEDTSDMFADDVMAP